MILNVNVSHIHWAIHVHHWGSRLAALIRRCSPPVIHCSTGLVCLRWWMTLSDCSMWYGTPPIWPNLSAAKSSYWIWQKYVNMYHVIVNNTELLITIWSWSTITIEIVTIILDWECMVNCPTKLVLCQYCPEMDHLRNGPTWQTIILNSVCALALRNRFPW